MDFNELVFARRSVRSFTQERISQSVIENLLRAGLAAPSPNDSTPWMISVITNGETIQRMREAVENKLEQMFAAAGQKNRQTLETIKVFSTVFADAPLVLAVFSRPYEAPVYELLSDSGYSAEQINEMRRYPDIQATGALVQNILLAATNEGLGSCWVSGALVARNELETIIGEPGMHLVTMIALGFPEGKATPKKPLDLEPYVKYIS